MTLYTNSSSRNTANARDRAPRGKRYLFSRIALTPLGQSVTPVTMKRPISRRSFVKASLLASAAVPIALKRPMSSRAEETSAEPAPSQKEPIAKGWIADQQFTRLMMGGNLISGYAHSRDLPYVSTLMRRYNSPSKIRETLELGESNGITAINTWVQDDNTAIFEHWKNGGKMKWISQTRLDAGGGFSQIQKAIDQGAVGVHLTGDACEGLVRRGEYEKVAESVRFIKSQKRIAGVGAHDLAVIIECEKQKLDVDFYQKTMHSHEYYTAPRPEEKDAVGPHDNSWCSDPQAVIDVMAKVKKPFIAFKILAAGAIQPRAAFPWAFNNGADFILVGMFDWQIEENTKLAKRVLGVVMGPNSKRTRAWYGTAPQAA